MVLPIIPVHAVDVMQHNPSSLCETKAQLEQHCPSVCHPWSLTQVALGPPSFPVCAELLSFTVVCLTRKPPRRFKHATPQMAHANAPAWRPPASLQCHSAHRTQAAPAAAWAQTQAQGAHTWRGRQGAATHDGKVWKWKQGLAMLCNDHGAEMLAEQVTLLQSWRSPTSLPLPRFVMSMMCTSPLHTHTIVATCPRPTLPPFPRPHLSGLCEASSVVRAGSAPRMRPGSSDSPQWDTSSSRRRVRRDSEEGRVLICVLRPSSRVTKLWGGRGEEGEKNRGIWVAERKGKRRVGGGWVR